MATPRDSGCNNPIAVKRRAAGITQKELADALHTSQAYITGLERGIYTPRVSRLKEIADILGCDWRELA